MIANNIKRLDSNRLHSPDRNKRLVDVEENKDRVAAAQLPLDPRGVLALVGRPVNECVAEVVDTWFGHFLVQVGRVLQDGGSGVLL